MRCFHVAGYSRYGKVPMSKFDPDSFMPFEKMKENIECVKGRLNRPLTLSEKILYSHLDDPANQEIERGNHICACVRIVWHCRMPLPR